MASSSLPRAVATRLAPAARLARQDSTSPRRPMPGFASYRSQSCELRDESDMDTLVAAFASAN